MPNLSRRTLLIQASLGVTAGVAATTAIAKLPQLLELAATNTTERRPDLTPLGTDLVAHVRNASTGEIAILAGDHEVVRRDPELVGRLLRAARQAMEGA